MLEDKLLKAKKLNVCKRALRYNKSTRQNEWNDKGLFQAESDFGITLDEQDKRSFVKIRPEEELKKAKLHSDVISLMPAIFELEISKAGDKEKKVPSRNAAKALIESAELIALILKAFDTSTSQIRRYLDGLRKIKVSSSPVLFSPSDVLLQQVKIAYAAGRDSDLDFFYHVMKPAIEIGSKSYAHFEQLLKFVEAIVAYHKYYKGGD
jgi:CRISPR-associated protein Csm2